MTFLVNLLEILKFHSSSSNSSVKNVVSFPIFWVYGDQNEDH